MELRSLPKIELHLHLDCSLSYQAVSALAPSVTREEYQRDYIAPARCTNLADFLSRAPKGFRLMQTEDSLRLVTEDVFQQLVEDGVIYAEIRFAPLLHTEQGLSPGARRYGSGTFGRTLDPGNRDASWPDPLHAKTLHGGAEHAHREVGGKVSRQPSRGA